VEGTVKQITEYTSRSALLGTAVKDGEAEKIALKVSRDAASEGVRESERTMVTLSSEYDSVCAQLRDVGDDKRRSKQEERMSEAVDNMQRILSGVHGRLGDLCRPIQKKYAQVSFLPSVLSCCPFPFLF
jgi:structural maintenance of chromosome 1